MSYDIQLVIDTGGKRKARVTECRSPTYNLSKMFAVALGRPIRSLDGMLADDVIPILEVATVAMHEDPDKFKAFNPENGWGNYEDALKSLCWLLEMCKEHPKATVEI